MPSHNNEDCIKQTIFSVLNQTHKNFEIIVVDDASTDNTVSVIKSINDKRIKLYINERNSGAAFSRNFALSKCSGDYIAFLDGDDLWSKEKLEKHLSFMILNNISFSYTNYYVLDDASKRITFECSGPKIVSHRKFVNLDYVGCLTVMYRKVIYPDLSIPNDIYKRNDYALWLKLSEKSKCYLLDDTLAIYRKRSAGISSGSKFKLIKYHKIVFEKLYGYSSFRSFLCALRNVFFYIFKNMFYRAKVKKEINYEF